MMAGSRPTLSPRSTLSERLVEALGAGIITSFVILAILELPRVRLPFPIDFDRDGRADAWSTPNLLALLPAVAVVIYIALSVLQLFPERYLYRTVVTEANAAALYRKRRSLVRGVKIVLTLLSATLFYALVSSARESSEVYELCGRLADGVWRVERCLPQGE
jgi:hypothetical protein